MSDCTEVDCCTMDFSTGGGCGKVTNQILYEDPWLHIWDATYWWKMRPWDLAIQ